MEKEDKSIFGYKKYMAPSISVYEIESSVVCWQEAI